MESLGKYPRYNLHNLCFRMIVNWYHLKTLGMPTFLKYSNSQEWNEILNKMAAQIQICGARWLNPAGKIILLKLVLSALTIFQCASLLAPKGVLEKNIKDYYKFYVGMRENKHKEVPLDKLENSLSINGKRETSYLKSLFNECNIGSQISMVHGHMNNILVEDFTHFQILHLSQDS